MQVSVLIVSYNARAQLRRALLSVPGTTDGGACDSAVDTIVVDNASPDGSADMVRETFPNVTLLASPENRGFSAAINLAARHARGDALLLLNPDAELLPGTWARLVSALQRHPDASAIGFRQVDARDRFQLAVGPKPTLLGELLRRIAQRRLDRGDARVARGLDHWLSKPRLVPWVAGSSLFVRREAFERIGGFDERYFLYFEDIDFCLRLGKAGGKVYYDPTVTVLHHRGVSAATVRPQAERAYRQSQLRFWDTHRGPWMRLLVHGYLQATGKGPTG